MPKYCFFLQGNALHTFCRDSPTYLYAGFHPAILHQPQPLLLRRGFDLNPKPLCPLQGRGLTDSEGDPLHQSFGMVRKACALRANHSFLHPRCRRPWERGSPRGRKQPVAHIEAEGAAIERSELGNISRRPAIPNIKIIDGVLRLFF